MSMYHWWKRKQFPPLTKACFYSLPTYYSFNWIDTTINEQSNTINFGKAEKSQAGWVGKIQVHAFTWNNSNQDSAQLWTKGIIHHS